MDLTLIILNKNFEQVSFIDDFESFYVNRKLYDFDTCTLHTLSRYNLGFELGGYIYINNSNKLYEITEIKLDENEKIVISGKELLFKLSKKVIDTQQTYKEKPVQEILKDLVTKICINNSNEKRNISNLSIRTLIENTETISKQITGKPLTEVIFDFAKTYNLFCEINYEYETNNLYVDFYTGLDRTYSQDINNYAVFSEEYENISNLNYTINSDDYVNYLFIAGEGEGTNRTFITLDLSKEGEELKELYIDAKDLQKTDENNNNISDAEYKEILKTRGQEKAEENKIIYDISTTIATDGNLKYKIDYDLGDLCVLQLNKDYYINIRLSEINEIYENGYLKIEISLGNLKPTLKEFIKREVNK